MDITHDIYFSEYTFPQSGNLTKKEAAEIYDEMGLDYLNLTREQKLNAIVTYSNQKGSDFLLHEFMEKSDLEFLIQHGVCINRIYLSSKTKRDSDLIRKQKEYEQFNRWLDHPPGYVEEQHALMEEVAVELEEYLKHTEIELIQINQL